MANFLTRLIDPSPSDHDRAAQKYQYSRDARAWGIPLAIGAALMLISLVFAFANTQRWLFAYHIAWTFCLSISLGAMFFVMINHVTKAKWVTTMRRIPELLVANIPLLGILGLPVVLSPFFTYDLFHWADSTLFDPADPHYDPLVAGKAAYLNAPFFAIRALLYFGVWGYLAHRLYTLSIRQDTEPSVDITFALRRVSAWGIPVAAVTTAFAGIDFLMSLDPHWFSTMFGVYFFAGGWLAAIASITFIALVWQRMGMLEYEITKEHYHELGKYMFAFVVFWAYIAFSQYFLIWYANIPEETIWYQKRLSNGWEYFSYALVLGHFLIPLFVLLPRAMKRTLPVLAFMSVWVLVMHWIDIFWQAMPALHAATDYAAYGGNPEAGTAAVGTNGVAAVDFHVIPASFAAVDFLCWLGLVGLVVGVTLWRASRHSLTPHNDPFFADSLRFENM
ncbi:hypothetical protein BH23BAC4_BH23BAC4_01420 [soil metagenome]